MHFLKNMCTFAEDILIKAFYKQTDKFGIPTYAATDYATIRLGFLFFAITCKLSRYEYENINKKNKRK